VPLPLKADQVPTQEFAVKSFDGKFDIPLRLYTARGHDAHHEAPLIVYIHGGGMTALSHNSTYIVGWAHAIARSGVSVLTVNFRNASSDPFPAGVDDCLAALLWARKNTKQLGTNGTVVIAGESGGGNLTLATMIRAYQKGHKGVADGVISQAPFIARDYVSLPLHKEFEGYWFPTAMMHGIAMNYTTSPTDFEDPAAWPILATDEQLLSFPPTLLIADECDLLRGDAEAIYAKFRKLKKTDVIMLMNYGDSHCMSLCGFRNKLALEFAAQRYSGFVRSIEQTKVGNGSK